jgi:hypothetical protein
MAYFNGGGGGYYWLGRYVPLAKTTLVYCDACAETKIPLPGKPGDIGRHWETDFKWAPRYGGGTCCSGCGKPGI